MNYSPLGFFFIGIGKEDDLLILWKYQPEGPFDSI